MELETILPKNEYVLSFKFDEGQNHEIRFSDSSDLLSIQKKNFYDVETEQREEAFEMIQEYGRKFENAEKETKRVISEYGLEHLGYRDEVLAHFAGMQFLDTKNRETLLALDKTDELYKSKINRITEFYDFGNRIVKELSEWKETYDQLEGSPGERYSKIMSNDSLLEYYLKDGYIPSAEALQE